MNEENTIISSGSINSTPPNSQTNSNFLDTTHSQTEGLYSDLFQKNPENKNTQKPKKSLLEILTGIFSIVTPIIVILAILGGGHAFLKGLHDTSFVENYPFLCSYINSEINAPSEEKGCQSATAIDNNYQEKIKNLEQDIINQLSVYLPIKISSNAAANSPENTFITNTFNKKVNLNEIMLQFEKIRNASISRNSSSENIICDAMSISHENSLTVECSVYGGNIGDNDNDGKLGSSRIEATRFIQKLSNTQESHFILETPPTSLAVEDPTKDKEFGGNYQTRTPLILSLKYTPFSAKL